MTEKETRRDRFKRIAKRRTNDILDNLRILGNCSNRLNYDYSDEEIEEIFRAIEDAVCKTKQMFKTKEKDDFSFNFK